MKEDTLSRIFLCRLEIFSWHFFMPKNIFGGFFMLLFLTQDNTVPKIIAGVLLLALITAVVVYLIRADIKEFGQVKQATTRSLAALSVMAAVSSIVMLLSFEIIPAAFFLKLEFSVLIIFLVFIWFDFKSAIIVSIITNLINYLIKGAVIPFLDQGINFLATLVFLIPFVFVFRKYCLGGRSKEISCEINFPISKMIITGVVSVVVTTIVMLIINLLIIFPIYNTLSPGFIDGVLKAVSDNRFIAILSTFGLFNVIHWGSIAVVIVLFGRRLVKLREYIR